MSWLSPRGWALDMSGSVQIPIFISSGVSNHTVLYYFVPTLFSFMKQLSRFSGKHNTMLSYWMREELEHYCLALMKWNFKLHSVDRCVSYCGWGYSKYYWPAIFRNAISKFTVCIRMHNAMCLDGSILVCVCVRDRDEEREREGERRGVGAENAPLNLHRGSQLWSTLSPHLQAQRGIIPMKKKKKKKQMQRLQMQGIWNPPPVQLSLSHLKKPGSDLTKHEFDLLLVLVIPFSRPTTSSSPRWWFLSQWYKNSLIPSVFYSVSILCISSRLLIFS